MERIKVYIIVLNWNGKRDTISCLDSLRCLNTEGRVDYVAVVCDNDSDDGSVEAILEWARNAPAFVDVPAHLKRYLPAMLPCEVSLAELDRFEVESGRRVSDANLVLIKTGDNLGYAGGNNVGIRFALAQGDADFVWVLNNDTFVHPDALFTLVERGLRGDDVAMVGSTLCYFDNPDKIQARGGAHFVPVRARAWPIGEGECRSESAGESVTDVESEMSYVIGASLLVPRAFLETVGLMQEDYFLYYEELDWAERARRNSSRAWRLGYAERSLVFHKVGASAGSSQRTAFSLRYLYGNQLRFMRRFYPKYLVLTRWWLLLEAIKSFVKGKFVEAKVFASLIFSSSVSTVRR